MSEGTIKELVTPLGWKDTFVRAAKTTVQVLITGLPLNEIASTDIATLKVVGFSAIVGGVSIILNRLLLWTNS